MHKYAVIIPLNKAKNIRIGVNTKSEDERIISILARHNCMPLCAKAPKILMPNILKRGRINSPKLMIATAASPPPKDKGKVGESRLKVAKAPIMVFATVTTNAARI